MCNKDCFNCPFDDCIRDERQDERDKQHEHYHANIESKREYHREYARRHYNALRNTNNCKTWRNKNIEEKKQYDRERYIRIKAERSKLIS